MSNMIQALNAFYHQHWNPKWNFIHRFEPTISTLPMDGKENSDGIKWKDQNINAANIIVQINCYVNSIILYYFSFSHFAFSCLCMCVCVCEWRSLFFICFTNMSLYAYGTVTRAFSPFLCPIPFTCFFLFMSKMLLTLCCLFLLTVKTQHFSRLTLTLSWLWDYLLFFDSIYS